MIDKGNNQQCALSWCIQLCKQLLKPASHKTKEFRAKAAKTEVLLSDLEEALYELNHLPTRRLLFPMVTTENRKLASNRIQLVIAQIDEFTERDYYD